MPFSSSASSSSSSSTFHLREEAAKRASSYKDDNFPDPYYQQKAYENHQSASMTANVMQPSMAASWHPGTATSPSFVQHYQHQTTGNAVHPLAQSYHSSAGTTTTGTLNKDWAKQAREEWKLHGTAVTQALEERRHRSGPGDFWTRLLDAYEQRDGANKSYTVYRILVTQGNQELCITERRYSDFYKLHSVLQQQHPQLQLPVAFPSKHWAGRMGDWTPSKTWAPSKHLALIQYRTIQLDVWLVHVMEIYNAQQHLGSVHYNKNNKNADIALSPVAYEAIRDFLTAPNDRPPCDQIHYLTSSNHSNPVAFTMGSCIRNATYTVQQLLLSNSNSTDGTSTTIPFDLLRSCAGLCFLTVIKAGLMFSGTLGCGLVVARNASTGRFSSPCALGTIGVGWGAQMGGNVTHYLILLTTTQAVHNLVRANSSSSSGSKKSVRLGAEFNIAVGPAGHTSTMQAEAYGYALSKGLFVGLSLEGSVLSVRDDVNAKFYGQPIENPLLLLTTNGAQQHPRAAEPLYAALEEAFQQFQF